jgi:hypothetical protein
MICGCTTNGNLIKSPSSIKLFGTVAHLTGNGEFEVSDGQLYICAESAGCHLIGNYEGNGIIDDYGVRPSALVFVDCRAGEFKSDGGQIPGIYPPIFLF